jgi:hypothetical protein
MEPGAYFVFDPAMSVVLEVQSLWKSLQETATGRRPPDASSSVRLHLGLFLLKLLECRHIRRIMITRAQHHTL